jgi:hypothetical protein
MWLYVQTINRRYASLGYFTQSFLVLARRFTSNPLFSSNKPPRKVAATAALPYNLARFTQQNAAIHRK